MTTKSFKGRIGVDVKGEIWPCVEWVDSVEVLGTGKAVKVIGTVDGQEIVSALMPTGRKTHMIPLGKKMLEKIGKKLGDEVEVKITGLV